MGGEIIKAKKKEINDKKKKLRQLKNILFQNKYNIFHYFQMMFKSNYLHIGRSAFQNIP